MRKTTLQFLGKLKPVPARFAAGVSLHSHTLHSQERLPLLDCYRRHYRLIPLLLKAAAFQHRRATGERLELERAFWRPPLSPGEAVALETAQIRELDLPAMVSLTDHDSIEAGLSLADAVNPSVVPVSVEWTVPFGPTFFHIGVHNLPPDRAAGIFAGLRAYTARPGARRLGELLESLSRREDTLVVLNHPWWDEGRIGAAAHAAALRELLAAHGQWIHALELNGLRPWSENAQTIALAADIYKPYISGGDRHGAEPNACINLTRAHSFAGFVAEVRREGLSEVAFLPQHREPLRLRWLEAARDILRHYPAAPEHRRSWTGRFFYECADGICRPVSELWSQPAATLGPLLSILRVTASRTLRPALRLAFADAAGPR